MIGHNPDILTCLANLSADEVFTPPKLASAMLCGDLGLHNLHSNCATHFPVTGYFCAKCCAMCPPPLPAAPASLRPVCY